MAIDCDGDCKNCLSFETCEGMTCDYQCNDCNHPDCDGIELGPDSDWIEPSDLSN